MPSESASSTVSRSSGQPSASRTPFTVSGCSGQRSTESRSPSPSVSDMDLLSASVSGQPSSSSTLLYVSGELGHSSALSGMPSESASPT